jgi:hypothetical protein
VLAFEAAKSAISNSGMAMPETSRLNRVVTGALRFWRSAAKKKNALSLAIGLSDASPELLLGKLVGSVSGRDRRR